MRRYRLANGVYSDKTARPISLVEVPGVVRPPLNHPSWSDSRAQKTFYEGDVFEIDKDLSGHNVRAGKQVFVKFEELAIERQGKTKKPSSARAPA